MQIIYWLTKYSVEPQLKLPIITSILGIYFTEDVLSVY